MSQAHIEQFYSKALNDPAILNAILADTKDEAGFPASAAKVGKAHGFDFTADEADAWIKKQQAAKARGELSDSQLEGVAGGKGTSSNTTSAGLWAQGNVDAGEAYNPNQSLGTQITSGIKGGFEQIVAYLTSW
jgi:hypothetical protein